MVTRLNAVRVASGFDQTLTDNDNIEDFTPNVGSPMTVYLPNIGGVYCFVNGKPQYSEGQSRLDFSTAQSFAGFKQVTYNQPRMHRDTLAWLKTNYRGAVSANVQLDGTSYSDWNAYLRFEIVEQQDTIHWFSVNWIFQLIEEIA